MSEKIKATALKYDSAVIGKIPFDRNVHDALIVGKTVIEYGKGDAFTAIIALNEQINRHL